MKKYIAILIFTLCGLGAYGQVSFNVEAPMTVEVGSRFRVAFVLTNAEGGNFSEPTIANADVLAGPTIAVGTNVTFIKNVQTSTTTQSFTYVLQAKSGVITIGAARITVNGKTYTTKSQTIEVVSSASSSNPANQQSMSGKPKGASTMAANDILLRVDVDRKTVYKGEAVGAILKIYTRVGISGLESPKYAAFNGFWAQEIDASQTQPQRVNLGGKVYESIPLRHWLLYPQRTGTLEIEQNSFTAIAQMVTYSSGNSLFDEFFGGGSTVEHVKKNLVSPPVKIQVLDLPKPQPATFDGAVGKFTMTASISSNTLSANSSGSITFKLSGTGNFPLITAPTIEYPAGIEKYETKTSDDLKNTVTGTSGTRTWEFPFITRAEGSYTIPAIEISYFDLATKSYKTLSSGDFQLTVTRDNGSGQTAGAFISGVTKEDLKMLGQDIRFIKVGDADLKSGNSQFLWSLTFFAIVIIVMGAFVAALYMLRKMIAQRVDVARTKNKQANKVALRRLKKAKAFMLASQKEKFFEEMLRALWGYMGDKLTIEVADLTKERVQQELMSRGVTEDQAEMFLQLIGQCELAQYAPAVAVPMEQAYNQALEVIGSMELR